jgi:hypothetical protein
MTYKSLTSLNPAGVRYMAPKRELPNLENATPGFLLDMIATERAIQKEAKYLEGVYRQALDSRRDLTAKSVESDTHVGEYVESAQERLDSDAIRESVSHDDLVAKGWLKVIAVTTLRIISKPL